MSKVIQESVLMAAEKNAKRWLSAVRFDGRHDVAKIAAELSGPDRLVKVVTDPKDVPDACLEGAREIYVEEKWLPRAVLDELAKASDCIWDYYLSAFYESALSAAGLEVPEYVFGLEAAKAGCGFVVNLGSLWVALVLPHAELDALQQLHCETGPALEWDRTKSWWWHGIQVDQRWIEDRESLDVGDFHKTQNNLELRRVFFEIVGWERILDWMHAEEVAVDDYGKLLEAHIGDDEGPAKFCDVTCPTTGRRYLLRVPPETTTCREGLAWSARLDTAERYEFSKET